MELPPSYTFLHPANTPKNIREGERKKERTERARERERAERSSFRFRARLSSILTILRPSSSALIISCPRTTPPFVLFLRCSFNLSFAPKKGPIPQKLRLSSSFCRCTCLAFPNKKPFPRGSLSLSTCPRCPPSLLSFSDRFSFSNESASPDLRSPGQSPAGSYSHVNQAAIEARCACTKFPGRRIHNSLVLARIDRLSAPSTIRTGVCRSFHRAALARTAGTLPVSNRRAERGIAEKRAPFYVNNPSDDL